MKQSIWKYIFGTFYLKENPELRFIILLILFVIIQDEVSGFERWVSNSPDRFLFGIPIVILKVWIVSAVYRFIWYSFKENIENYGDGRGGIVRNIGWCPYCTKKINPLATKCPHCTADL